MITCHKITSRGIYLGRNCSGGENVEWQRLEKCRYNIHYSEEEIAPKVIHHLIFLTYIHSSGCLHPPYGIFLFFFFFGGGGGDL